MPRANIVAAAMTEMTYVKANPAPSKNAAATLLTRRGALNAAQTTPISIAAPMVAAGEDIRWVPRRLVSSVALPGNDFYLFDDLMAVFLLYAGSGRSAGMVSSTDPADLRLCRSAFETVWKLSIPHRAYQPV